MKTTLTIENLKRIRKATLKDFDKVNYLVGRNGSGKTSILNLLAHLTHADDDYQDFFKSNSTGEFTFAGKYVKLKWEEERVNHTVLESTLNLRILTPVDNSGEFGRNGVSRGGVKFTELNEETLRYVNETAFKLGMPQIGVQIKILNAHNNITRKVYVDGNGEEVLPHCLSSGLKSFTLIRYILAGLKDIKEPIDLIMILLEEIENNLHPDLQKDIPAYINEVLSEAPEHLRGKICVVATTHSPFIASAASKYSDHKVYLLDNGGLVTNEGEPTEESAGYNGNSSVSIIADLLGGDITDLGYTENIVVVEEDSMCQILKACAEKNIVNDFTFISVGGVNKMPKMNQAIIHLNSLNTLLKCNPFYGDKYIVILDSSEGLDKGKKAIYEKLKSQKKHRPLVELSKSSIEDYYSNLDLGLFEAFQKEFSAVSKKDHEQQGKVKSKYALDIAGRISSPEDFSKLFNGELDFLIKKKA